MSDQAFQKFLKKTVGWRTWSDVASDWLGWLPSQVDPVAPPEDTLNDSEIVRLALSEISDSDSTSHVLEVNGVRELVFLEGLFLFHKAANVASAAEAHANLGMLTWSLSSAYHAAFFGAKAISRFLGVATFSVNSTGWIVDVFPASPDAGPKQRDVEVLAERALFRRTTPVRMEQRHEWQVLQRLMRATKFTDGALQALQSGVANLDFKDMGRQRNRIHYGNNTWNFDDLYKPATEAGYGLRSEPLELKLERDSGDFSMLLSSAVLEFAHRLLTSIQSNKLRPATSVFENYVASSHFPLFSQMQRDCFAKMER